MPLTSSQNWRLLHQLDDLTGWLGICEEDRLKKIVIPGKWSIWQNAVHLISYQPTFLNRIHRMLAEHEPLLEKYFADQDPLFSAYEKLSRQELVEKGLEKRKDIVQLLGSLSETELSRKGIHPVYGNPTLKDWTEFFLLHESHHCFTAFKLMQLLDLHL